MRNKLLHCYIATLLKSKNTNCLPKQFNNLKPAFTLVELILYMALLAVFLIVSTDMFVSILDVSTESEATSAVEQDGRAILARFNLDIANADSISIPTNLGETSNNLELTTAGTTYTYSLYGERLTVSNGSQINSLNSTETAIGGISFQRIGNAGGKETIKIQFDIQSVTQRPSGPEARTFTTTIGRR